MNTRIPDAMRETLGQLADNPDYGTLRRLQDAIFSDFIRQKPYRDSDFLWRPPAKRGTAAWTAFNVVIEEALQDRVKAEARRIEVNLQTFLYTALVWWIDAKSHYNKPV